MDMKAESDERQSQPISIICTLEECVGAAAAYYKTAPEELCGHKRWQPLVRRRQLMVYVMRMNGGFSLPRIARFLNRDHTTILHACRKVGDLLPRNPDLTRDYEAILASLQP